MYNGVWRAMLGYQNEFNYTALGSGSTVQDSLRHFVLTKVGSAYSFYENGGLVGSATVTATLSSELFFLCRNGLNNTYFQGSADQARLFNRALTADEITTLYQAGA